jgi:formate hydrogenlyase subunit 6/NADH:ubiquinone oxidoreductase subunit I
VKSLRILLRFDEKLIEQPITAQVIIEQGLPINIISAYINSKGGQILAEVPEVDLKKIVDAFQEKGVVVAVPELIEVDDKKCLSCGVCISLCPVNAISLAEDFSVVFDKEKCIGSACGTCVDACPARAIKSLRQRNSELVANNTR